MRSKDPSGVLSELTYSCDTFLSTDIKNCCGVVGDTLCVHCSLEENESVHGVHVCLHKYCLKLLMEQ